MLSGSSFSVRPLAHTEFAREAELVHTAYAAGPYAEELARDAAWAAAERDSAGRAAGGAVLVAVASDAADGGALLGAVTVVRGGSAYAKLAAPGEVELRFLAVSPDARGEGIGAALIRAGVELALCWGVDLVRLDTGVKNPAAGLYERLGFVRTPELDAKLDGLSYGSSLSYAYPLQERVDVRLREIRTAEIPEVSELVLAAYRDDYEGLPATYLGEIANVAERAAQHRVWVAEDTESGALLGTITTPRPGQRLSDVAQPGEMDLRLLGVARSARGRGIGSLIMRHGLRLARIRGTARVVLNTSTEMVAAYQLYDRMGFERLPEREQRIERPDGSGFTLLAYGIDAAAS
ncbi:GNAT family N-acetyltransferase [Leucobacter luti]|uniref:Acetyltransferase (GNAT) family protein n=1 Tax=Leucobacter luti TaxID=340320 RepID=A0A4V6MD00_9MICO|nr:GNAT family N-acetyltransferase [Leucobacter luti]RZT66339.1 acetyltransferase (GNAT) family protein [Leucobacter luti]